MTRETSADVASIAADLANITPLELANLNIDDAEALALRIRSVAASALGQREPDAKLWRDRDGNLFTGEHGTTPVEPLTVQVDRLASFIMSNVPGEPSANEGAIDTAIRIMRLQLQSPDAAAYLDGEPPECIGCGKFVHRGQFFIAYEEGEICHVDCDHVWKDASADAEALVMLGQPLLHFRAVQP